MVKITHELLLKWSEYKDHLDLFKQKALGEFLRIYRKHRQRMGDEFKWGDEIEYSLVKFDHINKKAYLYLKAEQLLEHLDKVTTLIKLIFTNQNNSFN